MNTKTEVKKVLVLTNVTTITIPIEAYKHIISGYDYIRAGPVKFVFHELWAIQIRVFVGQQIYG